MLVTGGRGVLGRAVLPLLAADGHDVRAPSRQEVDLFHRTASAGPWPTPSTTSRRAPRRLSAAACARRGSRTTRLRTVAARLLVDAAVEGAVDVFVQPTVALARAREFTLLWFLICLEADRGWLEFTAGDGDRAAANIRSAHALVETEDSGMKADVAGSLACVLAHAGVSVDEAKGLALEARAQSGGMIFTEIVWRRAMALVAARERRADEAILLSDEARTRADVTDWLTIRGETLEDAALVRRLAGDADGAAAALDEALDLYERKGNVVGARRAERARGALSRRRPT